MILGVLFFTLVSCGAEKLVISGSETMYPMLNLVAEDYNSMQKDVRIVIEGGGSLLGMKKLARKQTDIAASSMDIQETLNSYPGDLDDYEMAILAFDGIAIVVNKKNPVKKLSLVQLSDIFSGRIKNWSEVGGERAPIMIVVRNDNSGTALYMKEHVLRQRDAGEKAHKKYRYQNYAENFIAAKNNSEIAVIIEKNKYAISYMGMGSADTEGRGKVKKLSYSVKTGGEYYEPTPNTVDQRLYRLSRPLMLIYRKDGSSKKGIFIKYLKTERARKVIATSGYLDSLYSKIMFKTLLIKGRRIVK
jgi:phosphate transport system substrate-binding protein